MMKNALIETQTRLDKTLNQGIRGDEKQQEVTRSCQKQSVVAIKKPEVMT